jgi:CBS domain-containing protein
MVSCKTIMTQTVFICEADDNIVDVARLMMSGNVGAIPVVASAKWRNLVGIITDRDIVLRVVANQHNPNTAIVSQVMSPNVVTCHVDDDIEQAMSKMSEHQIRRIPIVNNDGTLAGIIAQADIARYMDSQSTGEVVTKISEQTMAENS